MGHYLVEIISAFSIQQEPVMYELPHNYVVSASSGRDTNIQHSSEGLPELISAPPAQFGGPGDQWSPETLLIASIADCFILTFRAIARASKFDWISMECTVDGTLERVDRVTQFTRFDVKATVALPAGADSARAKLLMEKSERGCLITNSLHADFHLEVSIVES